VGVWGGMGTCSSRRGRGRGRGALLGGSGEARLVPAAARVHEPLGARGAPVTAAGAQGCAGGGGRAGEGGGLDGRVGTVGWGDARAVLDRFGGAGGVSELRLVGFVVDGLVEGWMQSCSRGVARR
jgi:hypothetical protein